MQLQANMRITTTAVTGGTMAAGPTETVKSKTVKTPT